MKIYHFSQQGKRGNNEDSLGTSAALLTFSLIVHETKKAYFADE